MPRNNRRVRVTLEVRDFSGSGVPRINFRRMLLKLLNVAEFLAFCVGLGADADAGVVGGAHSGMSSKEVQHQQQSAAGTAVQSVGPNGAQQLPLSEKRNKGTLPEMDTVFKTPNPKTGATNKPTPTGRTAADRGLQPDRMTEVGGAIRTSLSVQFGPTDDDHVVTNLDEITREMNDEDDDYITSREIDVTGDDGVSRGASSSSSPTNGLTASGSHPGATSNNGEYLGREFL